MKIYFFNNQLYDIASEFREYEIKLRRKLDFYEYNSYIDLCDMSQLGADHVRMIEKIIDRKEIDISWDKIPDNSLLKMRREIKLNKIFKSDI